MRARYYDADTGRFISEDPIGFEGGINLYAYCNNNPVNFVDPLGLEAVPGVGANTNTDTFRDATTYYHYTWSIFTPSINLTGLSPGYGTPTLYSSGLQAQQELALPACKLLSGDPPPNVYWIITANNTEVTPPSSVRPDNNRVGLGIEVYFPKGVRRENISGPYPL